MFDILNTKEFKGIFSFVTFMAFSGITYILFSGELADLVRVGFEFLSGVGFDRVFTAVFFYIWSTGVSFAMAVFVFAGAVMVNVYVMSDKGSMKEMFLGFSLIFGSGSVVYMLWSNADSLVGGLVTLIG